MKYRPHRGGLAESIALIVESDSWLDIETVIRKSHPTGTISIVAYAKHTWPDTRIDWKETYMVLVDGFPVGFTDSLIPMPWKTK